MNAKSFFHPERLFFLPPAIAATFRLLHKSCQFTVLGEENEKAGLTAGTPRLFTAWHFAFPAVIFHFRNTNGMLMVSRSRDGEWASRVLEHLGYRTFRGSPGKGGSTALKQLINQIRTGPGGGFIADGSQGPARIAQKGILLLARYAEAPLVPVSMAASPCWRLRSWDRTVVSKPFSKVVLAFGAPIWVDRGASSEEMERLRQNLEDSLNGLTDECEKFLGVERKWHENGRIEVV